MDHGRVHHGLRRIASGLFNTTRQIGSATGVALGGSLLATGADYSAGLRISMGIGALAYLTAAGLAWRCVPAKPVNPQGA